jgi:hypothetical protein
MVSGTRQNMEAMVMGELFWEDVDDEASRGNVEERFREMQKRQDHF